ncbi:hypothetical protein, partial [Lacticaseibacillus pantheris]|uniref:hypothetical protein n=1 Tax=Lacticaseibacillus pantheris TaxID=171523 RepID=UPI001CDAA8B5
QKQCQHIVLNIYSCKWLALTRTRPWPCTWRLPLPDNKEYLTSAFRYRQAYFAVLTLKKTFF